MHTISNIEIFCVDCGKPLPFELEVGRENGRNIWIFWVPSSFHVCLKSEEKNSILEAELKKSLEVIRQLKDLIVFLESNKQNPKQNTKKVKVI